MNDYTGKICPYCKTAFKPDDEIVVCSECDMPHHKQRFTRGYKRYKETSGLMEWKIGHIFHSIFT